MCNETILGKVFFGGSKRIDRLPDKVVSMLDSFIERGGHFLIGDCHGADLALMRRMPMLPRMTSLLRKCRRTKQTPCSAVCRQA